MIGIFDSGLGGLSVLAAIAQALPQADLLYFADSAHLPYGDKDDAFIRERVMTIGSHLVAQGCTLIVVACNTATAAAVAAFREALPELPVVGVEPGVKPAAAASGNIPIVMPIPFTPTHAPTAGILKRLSEGGSVEGIDPKAVSALLSLSREVIEQVVWEVVPDLAEQIIRERQAN